MLVTVVEELEWLVALLDVVLNDPSGYPCVEYEPWRLEYVPRTDKRCVASRQSHQRLEREFDALTPR